MGNTTKKATQQQNQLANEKEKNEKTAAEESTDTASPSADQKSVKPREN